MDARPPLPSRMARTPAQFAQHLRGARGRFAAATPAIERKAQEIFAADVQSFFDKGRGPDGKAWPPTRRKNKVLVLTGTLMRAAVRAAGAAKIIGGKIVAAVKSSRVRYGQYHQTGTATLPKRKWFGVSRKASRQLAKFIARKGSKAIRGK